MTIKELSENFPYLAKLAIVYVKERHPNLEEDQIINLHLRGAFTWESTEEKEKYWKEVDEGISLEMKEQALMEEFEAEANHQSDEEVEEKPKPISLSKDYWVVETDTFTYSDVITLLHLDDNTKAYIDVVQVNKGEKIFARLPKSRFRGAYKKI